MSTVITAERPDTLDAIQLITELDAYLTPLYPAESRHGFSVDKLLQEAVAFFVIRHEDVPACCGGHCTGQNLKHRIGLINLGFWPCNRASQ